MKLRVAFRSLFSHSDCHRAIFSNALHRPHRPSILKGRPYLPRCELRMAPSDPSRQRCIFFFYLPLHAHWPGDLLWLFYVLSHLVCGSYYSLFSNGYSVSWVCPTMRADVLLRSNSYYKPFLSHPLCGNVLSAVNLRGICS